MSSFTYQYPIGAIMIQVDNDYLTHIDFVDYQESAININETALHRDTNRQLTEYFNGTRKLFDLPVKPSGTPFQLAVWEQLSKIPYGETVSYKQIAERINNVKAVRAVGMANNRNPLPIVVPCHRVIGANGSLVGYGGGLKLKEMLLRLEQSHL